MYFLQLYICVFSFMVRGVKVSNRSWFVQKHLPNPRFGRRRTTDVRTTMTDDGRRTTDDGLRTTDDDDRRRTTEDGRRTTDDGRRTTDDGPFVVLYTFHKNHVFHQTDDFLYIHIFKKKKCLRRRCCFLFHDFLQNSWNIIKHMFCFC